MAKSAEYPQPRRKSITRRDILIGAGSGLFLLKFRKQAFAQEASPVAGYEKTENIDIQLVEGYESQVKAQTTDTSLPNRLVIPNIAMDGRYEPPKQPEPPPKPEEKYIAPQVFRTGDTSKMNIYVTIDDWWKPDVLEKALKTAEDYNARLTFFPVGAVLKQSPDLWRRVMNTHELGNHSWSHPDFTKLNPTQMKNEIQYATNAAKEVAGYDYWIKWFRPPGGIINSQVVSIATQLGMKVPLWSSDSNGWRVHPRTDDEAIAYIHKNVFQNFFPGTIILQHGNPNDIIALRGILEKAKESGYKTKTLGEGIQ